jgi:GT2 family glycosyltransferase
LYRSTGDSSLILSVIVPVYNEATAIRGVLVRIVQAPFTKEIIVVDDGSTDGTAEILEDADTLKAALPKALPAATFDLKIFFHQCQKQFLPRSIVRSSVL